MPLLQAERGTAEEIHQRRCPASAGGPVHQSVSVVCLNISTLLMSCHLTSYTTSRPTTVILLGHGVGLSDILFGPFSKV